jgi:hypothetical protein
MRRRKQQRLQTIAYEGYMAGAVLCKAVGGFLPMVVEDLIGDNARMLAEMEAVLFSKLIDGPLLLTFLASLLPDPVLVIQVL